MNFKDMQYLRALVMHKNVSKAAEELFISQPALSQVIQKLNREYQITLFEKRNGLLELTSEGELLYQSASHTLAIKNQLDLHFQDPLSHSTPLTVVFTSHMEGIFPFFAEYGKEFHSQLQLRFSYQFGKEDIDWDIKISIEKRPPKKEKDLLLVEQLCCAFSHNHPLAEQTQLDMEDLQRFPLLFPPSNTILYEEILNLFYREKEPDNIALLSDNYSSYHEYLKDSDWVSIVPAFSSGLKNHPDIVTRPLSPTLLPQSYYIILQKNPKKPEHEEADELIRKLKDYSGRLFTKIP